MLTKEAIEKNEALAGLEDGAKAELLKLANDATQAEVNQVVGRIHGEYERDFAEALGKEKPQGVKAYTWIKEEVAELKQVAESKKGDKLKADLDALKAERDSLKQQIEKGDGSEAIKAELDKARGQIEALETNLADAKTKAEQAEQAKAGLELEYHFTGALTGLKFKEDGISPEARKIIVEAAKKNVLNQYDHTYTDDGMGSRTLAFRNPETGAIYTNPATGKPYTATELIKEQPGVSDILDNGRQMNGTDSGKASTNGKTGPALSGGWKNQVEANDAIVDGLMAQGIARGTQEFQEAFNQAHAEHKVSDLPIQ